MKRQKRYFYLIAREQLAGRSLVAGVLDMLRYDGATVECNAPAGYYLLAAPNPPAVARWASFGVKLAYVQARATEDPDYHLVQWAREQQEPGTRGLGGESS